MRHQARLDRPVSKKHPEQGTEREHLIAAAEKGRHSARARLEGPEYPEEMADLHEWARELDGARRMGRWAPDPIGYADIEAWARLTGRSPDPLEVEALIAITTAMVARDYDEEDGE